MVSAAAAAEGTGAPPPPEAAAAAAPAEGSQVAEGSAHATVEIDVFPSQDVQQAPVGGMSRSRG